MSLNDVKRHVYYSQNKCCYSGHLVNFEYFKPILPSLNFLAHKYQTVGNEVWKQILCPAEIPPALMLTGAGISSCWLTGLMYISHATARKGAPLHSCSVPDAAFLSPSPAAEQAVPPSPAHCLLTSRAFCWMLPLAIIISTWKEINLLQNGSRPATKAGTFKWKVSSFSLGKKKRY